VAPQKSIIAYGEGNVIPIAEQLIKIGETVTNQKDATKGVNIIEYKFIRALLGASVQEFLSLSIAADLFVADSLAAFKFICKHVAAYNIMPSAKTLVGAGYPWVEEVESPEPLSYYYDHIINKHNHGQFNFALKQCSDDLKSKNLVAIAENMRQAVGKYEKLIRRKENVLTSTDFIGAYQKCFVQEMLQTGILSGWATADRFGTVLGAGDVGVICGRPGTGKTMIALRIGHFVAASQGKRVLVISLEMPDNELVFRYGAIEYGIPLTQINKLELTTALINKIKATPSKAKHPVTILGNTKVRDLESIRAEIMIYNPDLIIVDAAYLVELSNSKYMGKYEKIGESIKGLKRLATECGVSILATYQLNREATKAKNKGEPPDLSNLAGSDDIGQIASIVLALDEADTNEPSRNVYVLKNRKGAKDQFEIAWDLEKMLFHEIGADAQEVDDDSYKEVEVGYGQ